MSNLSDGEKAVLMQLSRDRGTADGDIIGKSQRDSLIRQGLAFRAWGRTTPPAAGERLRSEITSQEQQG